MKRAYERFSEIGGRSPPCPVTQQASPSV
ncbi:MAG TPA: hypothetical protein VF815_07190 [Myxococcaceae bacterium]